MRIGIIGAMNEEIIKLKNMMKIEAEENVAGFIYYVGEIENKKVVLVESGIGKVNSAVCTTLLLQKYNIEKIIFTGVAGAVGKELNIGDIVVSSELIEHDFDCTAFGMEPGVIPRMENSIFKGDKKLIDLATISSSFVIGEDKVRIGRVVSGDQFIASKEKIDWLRETFDAQCTEMEGASVAHVCYLFKIPFVIIRAISDKADGSAEMDFNEFVILAAENSKNVLVEMLRRW